MKKVLTLSALLFFSVSVYAQTEFKEETNWQKAKNKCSELYVKAKNNKYLKYGAVGATSALVIGSGVFAGYKYKHFKNKKEDK